MLDGQIPKSGFDSPSQRNLELRFACFVWGREGKGRELRPAPRATTDTDGFTILFFGGGGALGSSG